MPASVARDRQELDIRLMLGVAYLSSLGWAAVQVVEVLTPARELANKLNEQDKLVAILYYIWCVANISTRQQSSMNYGR